MENIKNIGIIFGSDTGITQDIAAIIKDKMLRTDIELIEVSDVNTDDFKRFDLLLLGLSTWYDGDLQSDWEDYFDTFKTIDFTDKILAFFGLGDQYGYPEFYVDGIGILAEVVIENGGTIIGNWSTDGYDFTESKALVNKDHFYGLALDEDNEAELTDDRIDQWLEKIKAEYHALQLTSV